MIKLHNKFKRRLKLYNEGYSDEELARIDNVKTESIIQWRYRNKLPNNYGVKLDKPVELKNIDNRVELYEQGLTYTEIAKEIGIDPTGIAFWFRERGYKPNKRRMGDRTELYEQGLTDLEIAEIIGVSSNAIGQWRRIRGLKPNKKIK